MPVTCLAEGKISMGHARALLGVPDKNAQARLAQQVFKQHLSVRKLEQLIQQMKKPVPASEPEQTARQSHIHELEQEMTRSLGSRVNIKTSGKKTHRGKITIEFYNLDNFESIRQKLLS